MSRIDTVIIRARELVAALGDNTPGSDTIAPHLAAPRANLQAALADLELAKAQTEEAQEESRGVVEEGGLMQCLIAWAWAKQRQSESSCRTALGNALQAAKEERKATSRDARVADLELLLQEGVLSMCERLPHQERMRLWDWLEGGEIPVVAIPTADSIYSSLMAPPSR